MAESDHKAEESASPAVVEDAAKREIIESIVEAEEVAASARGDAERPEIVESIIEAEEAVTSAGEDAVKPVESIVETVKESLIEAEQKIASFFPVSNVEKAEESLIKEVESVLPTSDEIAGESSEPPAPTEVPRSLGDEGKEDTPGTDGAPETSSWKNCCGLLALFNRDNRTSSYQNI